MSKDSSAAMTQARFVCIVEAYGADPARWPQAERAAAKLWISSNDAAKEVALQASLLDGRLAASSSVPVPAALERRVLDDFERAVRPWTLRDLLRAQANAVWPGAPVWQPACVFATALAIGLGVAAFAPFDIAQQDDAATSVFALDGLADVDAGQGI